MKAYRKAFCLLLCAALLFSLAACGGDGEEVTTAPVIQTQKGETAASGSKADIAIGFVSADSFSPYKAKSEINRELMYLLHAGLFALKADLMPECFIAASYTQNGQTVTVTLKDDAFFSDGSRITADHAALSFTAAKNSPLYAQQLINVKSASVMSDTQIRFTLGKADVFSLNALTFPIIKENTQSPVGAGKYMLSKSGKKRVLKLNTHNESYALSQNNVLKLVDVSEDLSEQYAFMTHGTSVYIDTLDDFAYQKLSSKTAPVETTRLVFIGCRATGNSIASWAFLRRAINIGLDRTAVGGAPFLGQSTAAATPFAPSCYALSGLEITPAAGDKDRAETVLSDNGFNEKNGDGYKTNGNLVLSVTLLVCEDDPFKVSLAEAFKVDMKTLGIRVTVNKKPLLQYNEALKNGSFQLYVGEIDIGNTLALDEFFTDDGAVSFGIEKASSEAYFQFKSGKTGMTDYIDSFNTAVPFIPVCYRRAVMSYNESFFGVETAFSDPYYSVYAWTGTE